MVLRLLGCLILFLSFIGIAAVVMALVVFDLSGAKGDSACALVRDFMLRKLATAGHTFGTPGTTHNHIIPSIVTLSHNPELQFNLRICPAKQFPGCQHVIPVHCAKLLQMLNSPGCHSAPVMCRGQRDFQGDEFTGCVGCCRVRDEKTWPVRSRRK